MSHPHHQQEGVQGTYEIIKPYMYITVPKDLKLNNRITPLQLNEAERLLESWSLDFTELYNLNNCKFNFHLVVHLTQSVRRLGPLWANSLFQLESHNQVLLSTLRGSRHLLSQMATRLLIIPQLKENVKQKGHDQLILLVSCILFGNRIILFGNRIIDKL